MEDPVVVNPETVSKTASVTDGMAPVSRYGRAPKREKTNQERPTVTNPSLTVIEDG
jgi:hypothetical protein